VASKRCRSAGCGTSPLLIQANGYCVKCNGSKRGAAASSQRTAPTSGSSAARRQQSPHRRARAPALQSRPRLDAPVVRGCLTAGCPSPLLFVQANGLCLSCNRKATLFAKMDAEHERRTQQKAERRGSTRDIERPGGAAPAVRRESGGRRSSFGALDAEGQADRALDAALGQSSGSIEVDLFGGDLAYTANGALVTDPDDIIERVRAVAGQAIDNDVPLTAFFELMDEDRSGKVDASELRVSCFVAVSRWRRRTAAAVVLLYCTVRVQ